MSSARSKPERVAAAHIHAEAFLDDGHRRRLESLVTDLQAELDAATGLIARVRALHDLALWAGQGEDHRKSITVRLEDLAAALEP